ncbi:MAG: exosortase J [Terracidiphilus sp.]
MSATIGTRLVTDSARPSPLVSSSATSGSGDRSGKQERVSASHMLWYWIGLLTLTGYVGIYPQLSKLWEIWMTDPLRSIGAIILPASIALTMYVWRQCDWELRGSWWGLLPVALAFVPIIFSRRLECFWVVRGVRLNLIPSVLPILLYTGGILLLFAGVRVLRRAWFPLALLLCLQPVPEAFVHFLDLPMQSLSAQIARSFANLLGFPPTNTELLRLMFAPDFGMFIAPGCDGMRGAITLGYGALILGYLRRLSLWRWSLYVVGALSLGHLFNLIRLCALVLYYRVALGHHVLENSAKQADYVIGALLFCVAALVFWVVFRREGAAGAPANSSETIRTSDKGLTYWRAAALALLVLIAMVPAVRAIGRNPESLVSSVRRGEISRTELNGRIPTQIGEYKLVRVWQEHQAGVPVLETAAFEKATSGEIELGIWLAPTDHSIQQSLMTHGEVPKAKAISLFNTAAGRTVQFNTALYDDGIKDTLTGDTYCSPSACQSGSYKPKEGVHVAIAESVDHTTRGKRVVPIFFKIQAPHFDSGSESAYKNLSSECQEFLSHLDLNQLSQSFQ